jgi:hypothetical protein
MFGAALLTTEVSATSFASLRSTMWTEDRILGTEQR